MQRVRTLLRQWFSRLWNKQTLIFLFFLALSTVFWLFQTLGETYEQEFSVPIELRGVPSDVVITTDLPENLRITLRDKGSQLLAYRYIRQLRSVVIDFAGYANASGHVVISGAELAKQIQASLVGGTQLVSIKPDTLEFYYNYGQCKRVPVAIQGNITTANLYTLAGSRLSTDSVTVYASRSLLDTITAAWIKPIDLRNLSDTTRIEAEFVKVRGAKFTPNRVHLTLFVDRMVEKTVQVPVEQVNFPATKQLRTFPASVNVTFQVGMGLYRKITSENFVLVVNYEDLLRSKGNRTRLALKTIPTGVSHVRIAPEEVEYVIEDIPEGSPDAE